MTEASVGRKLKLIDFSESSLKYLEQFGITKGKIPAGTYDKAANTKDVVTAACGQRHHRPQGHERCAGLPADQGLQRQLSKRSARSTPAWRLTRSRTGRPAAASRCTRAPSSTTRKKAS
ncbi:MAG: hypothetical protein MZV70_55885 [Desulfobacterales bacterium]|nr:hypothetical protein [Desulfobacterales bacterium]